MVRTMACAVAGLVLLGGLLRADDRNAQATAGTMVKGTVKKVDVDNNMITVTTADGVDKEFKLTDQTLFVARGAESGTPAGTQGMTLKSWITKVHEGSHVTLTLDAEGSTTVKELRLKGKSDSSDAGR